MTWQSVEDLPIGGECVVRLRDGGGIDLPAKFLGKSVHQIAFVASAGNIYCLDLRIDRACIAGWMELPPFNTSPIAATSGDQAQTAPGASAPEPAAVSHAAGNGHAGSLSGDG